MYGNSFDDSVIHHVFELMLSCFCPNVYVAYGISRQSIENRSNIHIAKRVATESIDITHVDNICCSCFGWVTSQ
jgi:hypothetical protein